MSSSASTRRRNTVVCCRTSIIALSSLAFALSSASASSTQHESSLRHKKHYGHQLLSTEQQHLRPKQTRHLRERRMNAAEGEEGDTNDDEFTVVKLLPFELRLSGIPSASPLAVANLMQGIGSDNSIMGGAAGIMKESRGGTPPATVAAVETLLEHITDMGTRSFQSMDNYGFRFDHWDVGSVWSEDIGGWITISSPDEDDEAEPAATAEGEATADTAVATEVTESEPAPNSQATATENESNADAAVDFGAPFGGRKLLRGQRALQDPTTVSSSSNSKGSTIFSLGHNGTVTFKGAYWEDDPTSEELTKFLLAELNGDANRGELVNQFKPVVCTPEDIMGNDCNLDIELVAVTDANDVVDEIKPDVAKPEVPAGEPTDTTPPVTNGGTGQAEANPNGTGNGGTEGGAVDPATNPADNTITAVETESLPQSSDGDSGNNLTLIILVVVGACLVAMGLVGLLYLHRKKNKREQNNGNIKPNATAEMDENMAENELLPPAQWANSAYDNLMGSSGINSSDGNNNSNSKARSSSAAAKATSEEPEQTKPKSKIDNILEDMSDGDSSFISDSSLNTSSASVMTGLTGVSGILDSTVGSPTPLDDRARTGSRLSKVSTDEEAGGGGYLPKSLTKGTSPSSSSMRKQEEFEDKYRTRSAMAKLNLKKDILHVGDETHDAPEEGSAMPGSEGAVGGGSMAGVNVNAAAQAAGVDKGGYGTSRTISPRKNTSMMEKQRLAEKKSLLGNGSTNNKGGRVRKSKGPPPQKQPPQPKQQTTRMFDDSASVNSQDLILPVDFTRSDSVDMRGSATSGSDASEDDYSDMYGK